MDETPSFPTIMFLVALIKDVVIDIIVFAATVIFLPLGWVLGVLASIIFGGIFSIRVLLTSSASSRLMARTILRTMIAVVVGFVPVVRLIIPEFTVLVLLTYRQEKKEAKKKNRSKMRMPMVASRVAGF